MIREPMVEGETIERVYQEAYPYVAKRERKGPVDFDSIPKLIRELEQYPRSSLYVREAIEHLKNATNTNLPVEIREQHFDIAGGIVFPLWFEWRGNPLDTFIATWKRANGV
jgi:hypothetical protein